MDWKDLVRMLGDTKGDSSKLALATVDLMYGTLPEAERAALKEAVEAAAIPHWCHAELIASLLQLSLQECDVLLSRMRSLTVIEPFPARGTTAINVHEATRLAIRKAISNETRFREWSTRAANYFAGDSTPSGRIEWIYHRLCAEPSIAWRELGNLVHDWYDVAWPETSLALAAAMKELDTGGFLKGRAHVEALLCILEESLAHEDFSNAQENAEIVLALAQAENHPSGEARAFCVKGDVFLDLGDLDQADAAFQNYLAIYRTLSEEDPDNLRWKRGLVVVGQRAGLVRQRQGKLADAETLFAETQKIAFDLQAREPDDPRWSVLIGYGYLLTGDVLMEKKKPSEANSVYQKALDIHLALVHRDPKNTLWLKDLAWTYAKIGNASEEFGDLDAANQAFGGHLEIFRRVSEQDTCNVQLRNDLIAAYLRIGNLQLARGQLSTAQFTFEHVVLETRRMVEQDPARTEWQRALWEAHIRVGDVLMTQDNLNAALAEFEKAFYIVESLSRIIPDDADLKDSLNWVRERMHRASNSLN